MSFDEDSYSIGTAIPYLGWGDQPGDYPMPTTLQAYLGSGDQEGDYPMPSNYQAYLGSGDQEGDYPMPTNAQTPGAFGGSGLSKAGATLKDLFKRAGNFAQTPQGIMALLSAFAALRDRQGKIGGGAKEGMPAPRQFTRTMTQGQYGPIARYAAEGGLMQAYAQGGAVRPFPMQDGGFVMTAKAVKGAEKLADRGITSLLPDAKMIRGPGTGTSDDIPAYIQGPNGRTPAKLSNGEAYVPPGRDTKGLYALMHKLERKA